MQNYNWPSVSVSATNPSVGTNGSTAPTSSTLVAGINPSGNTNPVHTDGSNNLLIAASSLPLPTGAATSANQTTQIAEETAIAASVASLDSKTVHVDTGAVVVASSALPAGASTAALQTTGNTSLASIDTKTPALVSGRVPVDGSGVTQPVSGTVTVTQATGTNLHTVVDASALPTGAATEATLATRAADSTVAAMSAKLPATIGQKASAASLAVVLASDQSSIPVTQGSRSHVGTPVLTNYASTPVTSSTYVQIVASTAAQINLIELFDSSGQTLYLAVGAAASEVNQLIIIPGGNGQVSLSIPSGSRISLKATSTSATAGINVLNMYS